MQHGIFTVNDNHPCCVGYKFSTVFDRVRFVGWQILNDFAIDLGGVQVVIGDDFPWGYKSHEIGSSQ